MADPEGPVTFEAGGEKYTAVFGFRAMKAVETHYELPFMRAIQQAMPNVSPEDATDKAKLAAASADIRLSDVGKLFEFSLLKHHPDLTEAQADDLIDEIGLERVSEIISEALTAALVKEGGDDAPSHPRKGSRSGKTG